MNDHGMRAKTIYFIVWIGRHKEQHLNFRENGFQTDKRFPQNIYPRSFLFSGHTFWIRLAWTSKHNLDTQICIYVSLFRVQRLLVHVFAIVFNGRISSAQTNKSYRDKKTKLFMSSFRV